MIRNFTRRSVSSVITLWLVTLIVFFLLRVMPGDAVIGALSQSPGEGFFSAEQIDARRHELGLDRSWPEQYATWLYNIVRLDLGRSMTSGASITDELGYRFMVTLEIAIIATLLIVFVGVPTGVMAAARPGSIIDLVTRSFALTLLALPAFWVGLSAILVLAAWFGYFAPPDYAQLWQNPLQNLQQIGPAAVVLALGPMAVLARVTRTVTIEAMGRDYVRAARAKGLSEAVLLWRHAFRSVAPHALTVLGAQVVFLMGGAVVVEQVFNLPGIGRALVDAVLTRDYTTVQFMVIVFAITALTVNLIIDLVHIYLDPRISSISTDKATGT